MKSLLIAIFMLAGIIYTCKAQNSSSTMQDLPYAEIKGYPETYTSGNAVGRMIDGLGFRYYWATEGLTEQQLNYKPSEDSRTIFETMQHIFGLSRIVRNAAFGAPNTRPAPETPETYNGLRKATLDYILEASNQFKTLKGEEIEHAKIIYQRGENTSEFPFWNLMNGPLADAIYHTGQVTSFRRAAGNPINPFISQFSGKKRE